jgi:hypothetical protein
MTHDEKNRRLADLLGKFEGVKPCPCGREGCMRQKEEA